MNVLGLDLGGTKLASALFNGQGTILYRDLSYLENKKGTEVGLLIKKHIQRQIKKAYDLNLKVSAIGISVPGIYYSETGLVWAPNISNWDRYPLLSEISSLPESKRIKVSIDSDRACYILGETWQGCASGSKNAIFIAVGTGIGAGILCDGKILRGHNDIAGAVGWMALDKSFKKGYESCGFFEYHASGDGLSRRTHNILNKKSPSKGILTKLQPGAITSKDLFEAYNTGDAVAEQVIKSAITFWGMAVANLVSIFNPEKIIFGGGVFGPALQFLSHIEKEAKKWSQPISMKQVKIEGSALGTEAGLYGAGKLALLATNT
jgi:glucokinase